MTGRVRGAECARSPDGQHDVIAGAVCDYCRFCWIVPRYVADETTDAPIYANDRPRRNRPRAKPSPARRQQIIERDGLSCFYCEHELVEPTEKNQRSPWYPTVDHLLPRSAGGNSGLDNLVLACQPCNNRKGDHVRLLAEVIVKLRRQLSEQVDARARDQAFIDHLKWELFDAGLGEMPGLTTPAKGPRKRQWKRPRSTLRALELYAEVGERVCANLRAENTGGTHSRTAAITKRGRLLARRERVGAVDHLDGACEGAE